MGCKKDLRGILGRENLALDGGEISDGVGGLSFGRRFICAELRLLLCRRFCALSEFTSGVALKMLDWNAIVRLSNFQKKFAKDRKYISFDW